MRAFQGVFRDSIHRVGFPGVGLLLALKAEEENDAEEYQD
jgi:hypothetical protein